MKAIKVDALVRKTENPFRFDADVDKATFVKLVDAISLVEGRATARTLKVADIVIRLQAVEKRLDIKKKEMVGITVDVDTNAQDFPRAYKWTPESTWFTAEYRKTGWYITDIYRAETAPAFRYCNVHLTDEAEEAILSRFRKF